MAELIVLMILGAVFIPSLLAACFRPRAPVVTTFYENSDLGWGNSWNRMGSWFGNGYSSQAVYDSGYNVPPPVRQYPTSTGPRFSHSSSPPPTQRGPIFNGGYGSGGPLFGGPSNGGPTFGSRTPAPPMESSSGFGNGQSVTF